MAAHRMPTAAAAATAATAAGRDAMGPAVVEEEEDAEELIEQQLEASMRRRQALAEEIQHLRTQEAVARRGPPVHAQASAQARGREQEVPSSTETPRPHSAGSASADGAGRDSTEGRAGGQKGKAEVPALRSGATTPDNVLSRAKTPDAAPSRMKPSQRPLTAGAWRSTAMLAGAPRRERAKSASPESVLNRRKIFSEADWESFLARQSAHKAHQDKHRVIPNGLIAGLRPAPLLPLMHASGYHIQGCVYTEADWRNKRQHGKSPTWAKMDEGFAKPDLDTKFLGFLQRQNEALARRDKRVNGSAQVKGAKTVKEDEVHAFLHRNTDGYFVARSERMARLQDKHFANFRASALAWRKVSGCG
eukprot:Tamp_10519.p1 GENE.Tamp_10519~~Tamp_10519.p1  ORF type:complete len:362 (+),score=76.88 Tamp_10519:248-1333(+)